MNESWLAMQLSLDRTATSVGPGASGSDASPWTLQRVSIKCLLPLCVVLAAGAATEINAVTLEVKSGEVRYDVEVKTLGLHGATIVGKNNKLMGKIRLSENGRVEGGLIIPVVNFESNNTRRDRDVATILKYKEYPAITFEVVEVTKSDVVKLLTELSGELPMEVRISAAGGSKVYDTVVTFERARENEIKCATHLTAQFTDFGIKPPRFGFVLKTAPDAIELSGEVLWTVIKE